GEVGAQVGDLAVGAFDAVDDFVQGLGVGGWREEGEDERHHEDDQCRPLTLPSPPPGGRVSPGTHLFLFSKYSGPTRVSRGLAPCPGPRMRSCSIMSMKRAALG